jgi:hypothetical protein
MFMHGAHKEGAVEFLAPREQKGGAYARRRPDHNASVHLKLFADNLGHEQGVFDARCLRPPERVSVERWTRHGRAVGASSSNSARSASSLVVMARSRNFVPGSRQ